uniref:Keratin associated protein 22-1 n=2 Tax=Sus scrofa TaxID=9823 RepID=A0A4X1U8E0_PIG
MSFYNNYCGGLGYGYGGLGCDYGCRHSSSGSYGYTCYRPCCYGRYWTSGFF